MSIEQIYDRRNWSLYDSSELRNDGNNEKNDDLAKFDWSIVPKLKK